MVGVLRMSYQGMKRQGYGILQWGQDLRSDKGLFSREDKSSKQGQDELAGGKQGIIRYFGKVNGGGWGWWENS